MPINKEKAMTDAINAITKLDFRQLIMFNASISEHIANVWQHMELKQKGKENDSSKN